MFSKKNLKQGGLPNPGNRNRLTTSHIFIFTTPFFFFFCPFFLRIAVICWPSNKTKKTIFSFYTYLAREAQTQTYYCNSPLQGKRFFFPYTSASFIFPKFGEMKMICFKFVILADFFISPGNMLFCGLSFYETTQFFFF